MGGNNLSLAINSLSGFTALAIVQGIYGHNKIFTIPEYSEHHVGYIHGTYICMVGPMPPHQPAGGPG